MSSASGIIGGALVLGTLQLVLSSQKATTAFGKIATVPAGLLAKVMDAGVAAIPDHSTTASSSTSSPGSSSSNATAASYIPPPGSLPLPSQPTTLSV